VANTKITELTQLTNPVSTDVLPIVDVGADVTKKISIADLLKNASTGTADAPGIAFDGRSRNGIYSPGADQVAISTNGTQRITVQSDGNVLIGATGSATRLLTVNQTGITGGEYGISVSQTSATSNALELTIDSANALSKLFQKSTIPLVFGTNDTERMRLDSSGRLGLGTSSPGSKLEIRNDVAATTSLDTTFIKLLNGLDGGSGIEFANAVAGKAKISFGVESVGTGTDDTYIGFSTCFNAGALTERVRVNSSGNVGIGTTSPSTLLHLDTLNEATAITVAATSSTGGQLRLGIGAKSSGFQSIVATGNGLDIGTTLGSPITFFTNGTANERARIDSSGRLLVGTSSDSGGALLQVNGDRVRVATAKTPASASDTGTTGEICWDANYVYVCTATNTWKRTAIATW